MAESGTTALYEAEIRELKRQLEHEQRLNEELKHEVWVLRNSHKFLVNAVTQNECASMPGLF